MSSVVTPPLPIRLQEAFRRSGGQPVQPPTRWSRTTWQATLPEHHNLLASLPNELDRATVAKVAARAADDEEQAVQSFIAAMAWGYGPIGYGAFRTARVLRENRQSPTILHQTAQMVRREGGPAAFKWLRQNRLHQLGVSFATKYLYFCNSPEAPPALILDRLVQRWLRRHADCHVRLNWHVGDYQRYLDTATAWARELGTGPDTVEYLMFNDALLEEPESSHPALQLSVIPGPQSDQEEVVATLEALDDAANAFATLPGISPADAEDFERGLRQLRRIVLALRNAGTNT
ncbi:hypothetical protein [Dactylosporangium sp. NPDC000521]|uniref:8-oxoguanine DNA glycosylase OGG fold protein n=1 Tax=Dactylosporangium sp. NPDC000521 TaxID=3363975 RepID=UPI0036805E85